MLIAVPKETTPQETRVALTPQHVSVLISSGHKVNIEHNAGLKAGFKNEDYAKVGADITKSPEKTCKKASLILKIWAPTTQELSHYSAHQIVVCNTENIKNIKYLKAFALFQINLFGLNLIPRISRAQNMDILSSQDTVSGYCAAILGVNKLKRLAPLLMTAAGTLPPLKALVIGLGVTGQQASATLHRLGAQTYIHDINPEAKEKASSLGAIYKETLSEDLLSSVHLLITTAQNRGYKAPRTLSPEQTSLLPTDCVIIDTAFSSGGNIDHSRIKKETCLIQDSYLCRQAPYSASILYSGNMLNFCRFIIKNDKLSINMDDDIICQTAVCWQGQINHSQPFGK